MPKPRAGQTITNPSGIEYRLDKLKSGRGWLASSNDAKYLLKWKFLEEERNEGKHKREIDTLKFLKGTEYGIHTIQPHEHFKTDEYSIITFPIVDAIDAQDIADNASPGFIPFVDLERMIDKLTSLLLKLHAQGFVHGDIKPANLLGDILVDWELSQHESWDPITPRPGFWFGSIGFTASEIMNDETYVRDRQVDIFALGATLYYLLTGKYAYGNRQSEIISNASAGRLILPHQIRPEIPAKLSEIIARALARSREHRYQSVEQVLDDYSSVRIPLGEPVPSPRSGLLDRVASIAYPISAK